jgi:hypothetical protein
MINIEGLDKAVILQALYRRAKAQGLGLLQDLGSNDLSLDEASKTIQDTAARRERVDYVKGRVIKVDFTKSDTEIDPYLYDRDNGQGTAQSVIDSLRNV